MLSLKKLPYKNLKGSPGRTWALILFAIIMSIASFGGTLLISGIRQSLDSVQSRLGADILVTPEDAKNEFDAQTYLLQADPGYFYMDAGKLEEILAIESVEKASPQLFLASTSSSCCSAKLQIVGFDPDTDFTVQPWIGETFGTKKIGLMDVIVGSNVTVYDDYTITLYGNECHIVGQFAPTGSTLDNAVYTNFETIKVLLQSSLDRNLNKYIDLNIENVISAILIKVKPDADIETTAAAILNSVQGISTATAGVMVSGIAAEIDHASHTINIFILMFWMIGLLMTVLLFTLMIHERRREFASLISMGANKPILRNIVIGESIFVYGIGSIIGIILSAVILIGFSNLVQEKLGIGFVIPSAPQILLLALISAAASFAAAAVSVLTAIHQATKIDAAQILKEGE